MTFSTLLLKHKILRERLVTIDKDLTLNEIGISIPTKDNDELSFLRLVLWGYVFLNENAKTYIKFFSELTEVNKLGYIGTLRTYMAHNLSLTENHDVSIIKDAHRWFISTCGSATVNSDNDWKKCFQTITQDLIHLLDDLINSCNLLTSEDDGASNLANLKDRKNKDWEAYKFDVYVEKGIKNLGYDGIDTVAFRGKYLNEWRKIIKIANNSDIDKLLSQRIEADLIASMSKALPYDINDLSMKLNIYNSGSLQALVVFLQDNVNEGKNLKEVIEQVFIFSLNK